jgi:hypothetical protein
VYSLLRAARPAYSRWPIAPEPATAKIVVRKIVRDGPQKHERPLRPGYSQEGVELNSAPTTLREVVEVLWSPRDHRDHLYGASMSPATRDVKLFLEPLPRSWECRLPPPICTALAMVELNRQAASDEKAKIGEGAVGILAWHCGECCSCWESAKMVEQVSQCRELTRAFRFVFK